MGRGWTFEALAYAVAGDYDRVVVKKSIRRLEGEGVLVGSRPRGPGFGPRLLTIGPECPGSAELAAVIEAAATSGPTC